MYVRQAIKTLQRWLVESLLCREARTVELKKLACRLRSEMIEYGSQSARDVLRRSELRKGIAHLEN